MAPIGDLNQDGKIDRQDLDILKQVLEQAGYDDESLLTRLTPDELAQLDINEDGQLDQDDIEQLLQLILKGNGHNPKQLSNKFMELRKKVR